MKKEKSPLRFAWILALAAALVLAAFVVFFPGANPVSSAATPDTPRVKAPPSTAFEDTATAVAAAPTPVRRPSAATLSQWMQTSNDDLARRAEDYQLDAPRRRNELGEPEPFRENTMDPGQVRLLREAAEGSVVRLDLFPDVGVEVKVGGRWSEPAETRLVATVQGYPEGSRFSMSWMAAQTWGLLELPSRNLAYEVVRLPSGQFVAREWLYSDKVCARPMPHARSADTGMPPAPGSPAQPPTGTGGAVARAVPSLNSRPGAVATIYLDFDGEVVSGTSWLDGRTINALPARMTTAQIEETWRRVSSHFGVFDVNITTDRAIYDAAPDNRKTQCVITPTTDAAPDAGGVAYLFSFTNPSRLTKVCWNFADTNPADAALITSHEVGHTLGLNHHGRVASSGQEREEYYRGHGTGETGWGPFMGAPYGQNLLQWSKGEYVRANNSSQDDLAVLSTPARIPFLNDDHGSTLADAVSIQSGTSVNGQIERNTDGDLFKVELDTGAQPVSITLLQGTMLDAEIKVYDSAGRLLQTVNPVATLAPSTTVSLQVWDDVYIEIRGTGKAPVQGDGYSAYSSLGSYTLAAGTGSGTGPVMALMPTTLPGFRANLGSASASAPVLVRARRLTGPLNVTVPAPFEVSSDNTSFTSSVQATPDSTVHIRLGGAAPAGVVRGTFSAASAGAATRTLSLTGLVFGAPGGNMSFVQEALEKLHYFDPSDPPSPKFQSDYVLQFADYLTFLEGRLAAGLPDREARAETILRMTAFSPGTGTFDRGAGYSTTSTGFASFARLGLVPTPTEARNFVRTVRVGSGDPVPLAIPAGGLNGLSGAPWDATMGMAEAMRDFFNSRAFRERYPEVRLMNSSAFYNWMRDVMFPGRAMGLQGPEAVYDMMENGFTAGYPQLSARRAIARGAAAAFRSAYAGVLVTDARGQNDGSALEAPFLRRLNLAALRFQLWGDWNFSGSSPEFGKAAVLDLLRPPVLNMTMAPTVEVGATEAVSFRPAVVADSTAPINEDLAYSATLADGRALPPGVQVSPEGVVTVAAGALPPGAHRLSLRASNFAGASAPRSLDLVVAAPPIAARGAAWMSHYGLTGCVATGTSTDGDAFCLATEYAFGLDPKKADGSPQRLTADGDRIHIDWNALTSGASYTVEQSGDLRTWSAVPDLGAPADLGEAGPFHRRKRASVIRSGPTKFYRVSAQFTAE